MRQHFRYSPSQIARALKCPGSVPRSELISEEHVGEAARRGTIAHKMLEQLLKNEPIDPECLALEKELQDFVASCADYICREFRNPAEGLLKQNRFIELIETTIASRIYPEFGGTPDYVAIKHEDGQTGVYVVDMKTGRTPVRAANNPQLLAYLALVEEKCVAAGVKVDYYEGVILQAGNEADYAEFTREQIYRFYWRLENVMSSRELHAGPHCQWCKARAQCPAAESMARQALIEDFADDEAVRLARLLELAPAIRSLLDDVPRRMLELARQGKQFQGYKVVQGLGHRRWRSDIDPLEALRAKKILRRVIVEEKVKSPTQLEREGYGELIADLVERPTLPPTLVPITDRRPAIDLTQPSLEFTPISPDGE